VLRVVLAGAGMVSRHHLIAWSKLADAKVVAVADPHEEKAAARAGEFGIERAFADVARILDETRPDAIDIATPVETHAPVARLSAGRGMAVLCHKPLAPTLAEAAALAAEIGPRAPVMVHENWRFRTPYRLARDWIAGGRIGRVRRFAISVESSGLLTPPAGGRPPALVRQPFMAELPRYIIFELLIHHLDLARTLASELRVVGAEAVCTSPFAKGEERAAILLAGGGLFGTVTGDFAVPGRRPDLTDDVVVVGEEGRIAFDGEVLSLATQAGVAEEIRFDRAEAYQSGYDGAIRHFVEALRAGAEFETSLADNLKTLRLVDDAYAACGSDKLGRA
jgi:D-apiose dehydrogenase